MPETVLDYDQTIWTVFSVGVVASVVILYNVAQKNIKTLDFKIMALSLGLAILVYCFFATLGYISRRKIYTDVLNYHTYANQYRHPTDNYVDHYFSREVGKQIKNTNYFRARWMGEFILFIIWSYYLIIFFNVWNTSGVLLALVITFLFAFLSSVASNFR